MDPFYAFLIFASLVVLETLAHQFALPAFFRYGLPVFFVRRPAPAGISADDMATALIRRIEPGQGFPLLHFPVLSPTEIAIQERLFENRSRNRFLPVMRSLLRLDSAAGQVTLTGYLNLWVLFAVGYIVYRATLERGFLPVGILLLGLLLVSYFMQAGINRRIIDTVSQHDPIV